MNHRNRTGLTLMETMVALAIMSVFMTVAFQTMQKGMVLQRELDTQANRVTDTCRLAERLRMDCSDATHGMVMQPNQVTIFRPADGQVRYAIADNTVVRTEQTGQAMASTVYHVGPARLKTWDRTAQAWVDPATDSQSYAIRINLPEVHLLASCRGTP